MRLALDVGALRQRREVAPGSRDAVQQQAFATAYTMTILGGVASLIIATLMGVLLMRGIAVPITRMTAP